MNPNNMNQASQNQRGSYQNYASGHIKNQIQVPYIVNNSNEIFYLQRLPQIINTNDMPLGYNPINIIPSQSNPSHQILLPNSNIISNLPFAKQNQIPVKNIIINIPYNPIILSNQNMIQGNSIKVIPIYEQNKIKKDFNQKKSNNQNTIKSENNTSKNIVTNKFNKNSIIETKNNCIINGHLPIPIKLSQEAGKSVCKISYNYNNKPNFGTGFFMKFSNSLKLLITNYHVIFPELMNINNIQIKIWNNRKMILNLQQRYIKFLKIPKDITAIEIKDTDEIFPDIQFLSYDLNYKRDGYSKYIDSFVFSIEYPLGEEASSASGKITNIYGFEFEHTVSTNYGSSGSPIILLNSMMRVIGIHKNSDSKNINVGTFIGEIIDEINDNLISIKPINNYNNYLEKQHNYMKSKSKKFYDDISDKEEYISNYRQFLEEFNRQIIGLKDMLNISLSNKKYFGNLLGKEESNELFYDIENISNKIHEMELIIEKQSIELKNLESNFKTIQEKFNENKKNEQNIQDKKNHKFSLDILSIKNKMEQTENFY